MTPNLAASLYLISGVFFILALRGLSSPETSRQGNLFGILGMVIAISVTFLSFDISLNVSFELSNIFGFIAIFLASINIFGGFLVTQRMLQMYKKKKKIK